MSLRARTIILAAAVSSVLAAVSAFLIPRAKQQVDEVGWAGAIPALFGAPIRCHAVGGPEVAGARAEQRGLRLWDSYLYDPGDGVLAVKRLQLAHSCYLDAGLPEDTRRVAGAIQPMIARVESDYLTSRVSLESAVALKAWDDARRELLRLLALTAHHADHEYVRYLEGLAKELVTGARVGR